MKFKIKVLAPKRAALCFQEGIWKLGPLERRNIICLHNKEAEEQRPSSMKPLFKVTQSHSLGRSLHGIITC
jgi:hypothetical protein